jgi:hypothetical protein
MTNKVLLDTNSYLRLARIFHPLLGEQPGKSQTRMCILAETIEELKNSPRLQSKFKWYNKPEFTENRKYTLSIPKKHRKDIEEIEEHLWEHKKDMGYNTSIADVYMLACGWAVKSVDFSSKRFPPLLSKENFFLHGLIDLYI